MAVAADDSYRLIRFSVDESAAVEPLSEYLLELGAVSVTLEPCVSAGTAGGPTATEAPPETWSRPHWPVTYIAAMLPSDIRTEAFLQAAAAVFPEISRVSVEERPVDSGCDWVQIAQRSFQPIAIGKRLLIRFPWNTEQSVRSILNDEMNERISLTLEPGSAFGTGEHPTTQLCARWLESHVVENCRVLDYGAGSGILLMYACKLGADTHRSLGVDIDEHAIAAARVDAARNQLRDLAFLTPEQAQPQLLDDGFDLVVSNILAPTLQELAPRFRRLVRVGGYIALSGILVSQSAAVWDCYSSHFYLEDSQVQDEWVLLSGIRRC
jgi:ribosomal protein L11 methyltransferase